jgi:hypothetical protein
VSTCLSTCKNLRLAEDRAIAQEVSRRHLTADARLRGRVGFVVDNVALGQVLLRLHRFSPVNIIPPWLSILIYHLGDKQQLLGGGSSETLSQHIDMNNNKRHAKQV